MTGAMIDENNRVSFHRATFTRKQKLTKPIEFNRVFNKPFISSDACFKILARRSTSEITRLGMAVSRQIDKRAVGRNRIKRVVRESFRQCYRGRRTGVDIVVLPRHATASMSNERLFHSLKKHWSRLDNEFEG